MKTKYKIISALFIGIFFFFLTSVKVSVAQAPTWIGVEAGDKYKWKITVYPNTFMELEEDLTGVPPGASYPAMSLGFSLEVLGVSNELYEPINDFYYANVSSIMTISLPGVGDEVSPPLGQVVPRNDTSNYFGTIATYLNQSMGAYWGFFIVATDLNWETVASELSADFPDSPDFPDVTFTITARETGLDLYFSGGTFDNITLQEMDGYVEYNNDGVLVSGAFKYGGSTLASIGPEEEDAIPGYELPIIFGVSVVTTIGLIYYIKRKKR
jgi:hypothetical protein